MADNDATVLDDAASAVSALDSRYRAATFNDKIALKPHVDAAFSAYSAARLKLLAEGVLCSPADVAAMAVLRQQVTRAANIESLIAAAIQLAAFLAKIVA